MNKIENTDAIVVGTSAELPYSISQKLCTKKNPLTAAATFAIKGFWMLYSAD